MTYGKSGTPRGTESCSHRSCSPQPASPGHRLLHLIQRWARSCGSSQRNQFPDSCCSLGSLDGGWSVLLCARGLLQGRGRSQFHEQPVVERDRGGGGSSGQPLKHRVPFSPLVCPWVPQISGSPSHHQIPRTASVGNGGVKQGCSQAVSPAL